MVVQAIKQECKRTEVGVIPKEWTIDKIENFASISTGSKDTQDKVDDGDFPFFVRSQKVERIDTWSFDGEAVLTAGDGVGTGKVFHYIKGKFDFHQRVYKISNFNNRMDGLFFYYYFSSNFLRRIMSMTAKSSVDSVRRDMIAEMLIPVPEKEEQKEIARVISDVDRLIKSLEKTIEKKKNIKQGTVLGFLSGNKRLGGKWEQKKNWKSTELGAIPENWEVVPFDDFADKRIKWSITGGPFGSNLKSSDYVDEGVRIIQLQNIGDGAFIDEYKIFTSEKKADELLSCNIYPGEIILSKMGDPVARACFVPNQDKRYLMASDGIRLAIDRSRFSSKFVVEYINSPYFRKRAINASTGSTRLRIGLGDLKRLLVICPPKEEQSAIAEVLHDLDSEIEALQQERDKFKQLKIGMMQQLLTGGIRLEWKS